MRAYLHEKGIATGIHYPIPIHMQQAYRDLGYEKGSFPVTEEYAEQVISLPMYAELTPREIEYIAEAIQEFASEHRVEPLVNQSSTIDTVRKGGN